VPLFELAGRAVAVTDVFGAGARHVAEQAAAARGLDDAVRVLERALAPLVSPGGPPAAAGAAVAGVLAARGQVTVDALSRRLSVTTRHLERLFTSSVGLGPKRFARIVRLQEVMRRVQARPDRWVDVALDCGYADQPHLARDFRALAGATPEGWLRAQGVLAAQFTAPARLETFFA
jgi:AraC-like DNA-binding protein